MIRPNELKLNLLIELSNGVLTTTSKVWEILVASKNGELDIVQKLVVECPELIYAQYNYSPPIHFAVREGHVDLVKYLLAKGAHDRNYKTYPFLDSLETIAEDRGYHEILGMLHEYGENTALHKCKGDNGKIHFDRSDVQNDFEQAVDKGDLKTTTEILRRHPEFAQDETYFWGEGILSMPAKENDRSMVDLLITFGAKVPDVLKWTQFYYFENEDSAAYLLEKGMNPNTMSWQQVTILHDMAVKGNLSKAKMLIEHGAAIDPIEEEYQSTPLGLAARWGHQQMVEYLLSIGANPNKSGASWSTPLTWAKRKGHFEIENLLRKSGAH